MTSRLLLCLMGLACALAAPVDVTENLVETHEDGLLLLVPTQKVDRSGKTKREIEYELISIPGDFLRREIRQVANDHIQGTKEGEVFTIGAPSGGHVQGTKEGETFTIGGGYSNGGGSAGGSNLVFPQPQSDPFKPTQNGYIAPPTGVPLPTIPQQQPKPALPLIPSLPGKPQLDIGQVLGTVGTVAGSVLSTGNQLASGAQDALKTATQLGQSAAAGGVQAVRWVIDQKTNGIQSASQVVAGGLQYAGQLSGAVLRTLLQIPGIKARVLSEIVQAGQPLATTISDVIYDSADDLGDILEAKTEILRDSLDIIIRLIQDVLALNGRIIASFGAGGLDSGASLYNAGIRIGGSLVEATGNAAAAIGKGIGDVVQIASDSNIPPPPALPAFNIPSIPNLFAALPAKSNPLASALPVAPALPTGGQVSKPGYQ